MTTTIRARCGEIICHSGLVRDPPSLRFSTIGSARRKHSLSVPRDTAIHLPHDYTTVPVSALRREGIVSRKQNG